MQLHPQRMELSQMKATPVNEPEPRESDPSDAARRASPRARAKAEARVARRRRAVFLFGTVSMCLMLAMITLSVGSGCIFDTGGTYDGGGKRSTAPTVEDTATSPGLPTNTTSSSSSSSGGSDTGTQ